MRHDDMQNRSLTRTTSETTRRPGRVSALAALLGVTVLCARASSAATEPTPDETTDPLLPSAHESRFRYATEYPAIGYSTVPPGERIAALKARLEQSGRTLDYNEKNGYLDALLDALDIDPASQLLVFSRTSVNAPHISPQRPRAVYFNDDAYVGWVPGTGMIEIATMDPRLGPVFFVLQQDAGRGAEFDRQTFQCLRCHDSLTLTGGGVPRFILGSGYVDTRGNLVSHEGWVLTDQERPLRFRWGGWYVTGTHGGQQHLGNIIVRDPATLEDLDSLRVGNLEKLDRYVDTSRYPAAHSDIVALLVIEHQVHVQNVLTRVSYDVRGALAAEGQGAGKSAGAGDASVSAETKARIEAATEPLVAAMLFANEAPLTSRIRGSSGFAERFERRGPADAHGRSLRQFDLETRIFRYPLSYLVYSQAFDALPGIAKTYVYRRFAAAFGATGPDPLVARLTAEERKATLDILRATKPAFADAIDAATVAAGPTRSMSEADTR